MGNAIIFVQIAHARDKDLYILCIAKQITKCYN